MSRVNKHNYIERKRGLSWRDWWFGKIARVELNVIIPPRLYGKRFKIKVEVVEDLVECKCELCSFKTKLSIKMLKDGVHCDKYPCNGFMFEVER